MAHHEEPMDVDCIDSDFDNKENSYHHSNVLPCTEKGYEELDVTELNMKLRYSITPAASPMSKSYTAYVDNRNLDSDDSLNCINENDNLTRSLNSTMNKNDSIIKSLKALPLQTITTEQIADNRGSVLRQLDSTITGGDNNVTITVSESNDINENLSLPSSSSSAIHTPEATSPTNIAKNEEVSPIIRGLKSVFNMFRSSQSPIPPAENDTSIKQERPLDETYCEDPKPQNLASTPLLAYRSRDGSSKRGSPHKDSITFNDDLEKELQWKDETILFSEEKIPIHKLFLPYTKPASTETPQKDQKVSVDNLDRTVEYMDISQNNSMMDNTLTETQNNINTESDGEFVDCETTFNKNESISVLRNEGILNDPLSDTLEVLDITKAIVKEIKPEVSESLEKTVNEVQNESTNAPQMPDLTNKIVSTINEAVESMDNQNLTLSSAVTLDVTKDIDENISEENGKVSSNNDDQEKPCGTVDMDTLNLTKETVNESVSVINEYQEITDIEIQKEPLPDTLKSFDVTMPFQDELEPAVFESELPECAIIPDVDETFAEGDVSLPKPIELSTQIPVDPKVDDILPNLITHEIDESFKNKKPNNEPIVIENQNTSNEINQAQISFEVTSEEAKLEKDINTTQIMESEKTIGETDDTLKVCVDPEIYIAPESVTNYESPLNCNKVEEDQRENVDNKTDNLVACPPEDASNKTINVCETSITIEKQAQSPNNLDSNPEETPKNVPCNAPAEKPENIPLPDAGDFDTDLEPYNDKVETMTVMPPDVLETVMDESNLDGTGIHNKILNDSNIIQNFNGASKELPTSEIQNVLNETKDIVNSLTEIIGESLNNTMIQPEGVLDDSQNDKMEGIECTEETHVLPDLVNQTVHNMSVDCEIAPESVNHSQHRLSSEMVDDMPAVEENKPISEILCTAVAKIITEQSNESFNENKGHADAIVLTENIDVVPKENLEDFKNSKGENILNENKVLDVDVIPNETEVRTEVNEVPTVDEELVLSENNSPYVSVMAELESKPTEESFVNINIPLETTSEAPSSPPIRSKGYNFNFDEMDDPFATKAKIRVSPPSTPNKLIESNGEDKMKAEASKKVVPNRRRSQPPERKRPAFNKKKFNTTFDAGSVTNPLNSRLQDQHSEGDSKNISIADTKKTTVTMHMNNEIDEEVATILKSTQIIDKTIKENVDVTPENDISSFQLEDAVAADVTVDVGANNKSSIESMSIPISEDKTSSSEQSTYYSAAASSSDSSISRNVFNLPEIEDKNFNPFATKSKMRQSPPLILEQKNSFENKSEIKASPDSSMVMPNVENTQLYLKNIVKNDAEDKMDTELMEKDSSYNISNTTSSSKGNDDKNITTREVNTEDEDTEEGPFLESEDAIEKLLGMDNDDIMQFNEIPAQAADENADSGELFIDAEAFEFLLNQNKSNMVADSGKESLFLKFDPLFAKRISSDGVLAALNKVQKRQSTPTKPTRPSLKNEASPIAGPSTPNATYDEETNATQDSIDDLNITVAKPMMVVTPAVNPAVTPRNKTTTPPRSNRRSITFTSPAMAVIDRLLSLSSHNNSLLGQDTTITQASREHIEADLALTQLRELLAEKEISVYQLRSESKELKDRLSTMETQVKILEADGQERLSKINELTNRLAEKTKVNKSMAAVVEEYERTIASLIAETEQDKKRHAEERIRLINERDEQTAHLASMEVSFSDLHSKYEKSKQVILSCKANEETCKKSIKDFEENLSKMQTNYEMLKQHATSKLNHANQELQTMNKAHESEVLKMNAMIKRKEMHITSLEETLAQKTKANEELTAICDELINKVG